MKTVEVYKVKKILEVAPDDMPYIDCHIYNRMAPADRFSIVDVCDATETIDVRRLPITEVCNVDGKSRFVAYDPSLEREFGYPVTVMTDLLQAQQYLSEALRKYELEKLENEQMRQWYKEHIENASLTTRLKWVITGVK